MILLTRDHRIRSTQTGRRVVINSDRSFRMRSMRGGEGIDHRVMLVKKASNAFAEA